MRDLRGVIAGAGALFAMHCASVTPGVGARVTLVADDEGLPELVDVQGAALRLVRARLSVASVELLPCPDAAPSVAWLGASIARAHEGASVGDVVVDLEDGGERELGTLDLLPGEYCDVRIRVAPLGEPTLALTGGPMALATSIEREQVVRIERVRLDATSRRVAVRVRVSLARAIDELDLDALEPEVDALRALGGLLRSVEIDVERE